VLRSYEKACGDARQPEVDGGGRTINLVGRRLSFFNTSAVNLWPDFGGDRNGRAAAVLQDGWKSTQGLRG
jgi:hypothetical protein